MKLISLLTLLFVFSAFAPAFAQRDLEKADQAYNLGEFFAAKDLYKDALVKIKDKDVKTLVTFKIAECYRMILNSKMAESYYDKAIKRGIKDPLAYLYYGDALKTNEKYEEAVEAYKKYRELVADDPRGEYGQKSCENAAEWKRNPTRYQIENMAFFNSKEGDFSPTYAKKDFRIVYFTSSREGTMGDKRNAISGQNFTDLFETTLDRKGKWSVPAPIPEPLSSIFDEGGAAVNKKGNMMVFTRCPKEKNKVLGCQLYTANRKGNSWDMPEKLSIPKVQDSVNIGFPSLNESETILYFKASLAGGYGSNDIWMIKRSKKGKTWGEPINLGPEINTIGNESFPYIRDDSTLYFSSDYHLGMGGLDLFVARLSKDGKWVVENMKYPMNSSSDDFGIIFEGKKEKGFFTSNRPGGKGMDDIYYFEIPGLNFSVEGIVLDEQTSKPLLGSKVTITGSDGFVLEVNTEADGSYKFLKLNEDIDYMVSGSMLGYMAGKVNFSTKNQMKSEAFKFNIPLSPVVINEGIELPKIEYDYASANLRPESMVTLDKLVLTLEDNPNFVIELRAHTDFRGKDEANMKLSQDRAQSVVNYLKSKGIEMERMQAKGFGETQPKTLTKDDIGSQQFLKEGEVLTEAFINSLGKEDQKEICHQMNRRTEFAVIRQDFVPKEKPEASEESGEN